MHERALWYLISLTRLVFKSDNLPTVAVSCCFFVNLSFLVSSYNEWAQAFKTAKICTVDLKAHKKFLHRIW